MSGKETKMKFQSMLRELDRDDVRLARHVESAGLTSFSQAVKTIWSHYYAPEEDEIDGAEERFDEWTKALSK